MSRTALWSSILIVLGLAAPASAHFKLNAPIAMSEQDALGGPQKAAPCGLSDTAGVPDESTPTNMVTTVQTGSTLTISINETIFHPGHYRVSLAQNMAALPADPVVTPGSTACGSTVINPSPTLPLLADGLLVHTSSFGSATKTMEVQLPPGMTCTNCVLQVSQFMSNHALNNPGGCFYHHCATVTIANDAPPPPDVDAGDTTGDPEVESGCCSAGAAPAYPTLATLALGLVVGLVALRRRRR